MLNAMNEGACERPLCDLTTDCGGSGRQTGPRLSAASRQEMRGAALLIAGIVARSFSVKISDVYAKGRGRAPVALVRQAAIYVAHVVLRMTYVEAGAAFGRDRTTAAHACRRVEDRRDDAAFDARMALIERECAAALAISAVPGQEPPAGTMHAVLGVRA